LVFGGSFDPPHRGHAELLTAAIGKIRPERILIIPSFQAPFKGSPHASPEARLKMVREGLLNSLPLKFRRRCRIDAREARARRVVYTVETLGALKGELHFLVGQDSAETFFRWKDPAKLKSLATWWYGARPGSKGRPPAHFKRIPGSFPDVSSTELRSALALGRDCSDFLHPSVSKIIDGRGLYGWKLLAKLRKTLSPERFEHTLNVASLAESLALRHGAKPESALLAGLLHDMGRRFNPSGVASYVRARRLEVPRKDEVLAFEPMLAHAYVSADLAKREFSVDDPDVLEAVRRHTLGAARMSLLDKVLYVADACSADRSHPGAARTRALAFRNLDSALKLCVEEKLSHARSREAWIHPLTVRLWNSLAGR
jgi:nicotinate-nucleotide adenylyltransferase